MDFNSNRHHWGVNNHHCSNCVDLLEEVNSIIQAKYIYLPQRVCFVKCVKKSFVFLMYFYRHGFKFCQKKSPNDAEPNVGKSKGKTRKLQVGFPNTAMEKDVESDYMDLKGGH